MPMAMKNTTSVRMAVLERLEIHAFDAHLGQNGRESREHGGEKRKE